MHIKYSWAKKGIIELLCLKGGQVIMLCVLVVKLLLKKDSGNTKHVDRFVICGGQVGHKTTHKKHKPLSEMSK